MNGLASKARYQQDAVKSDWNVISAQLLNQWNKLTKAELEGTNHSHREIAMLIQRKYGVYVELTESYLKNLERTLPRFQ